MLLRGCEIVGIYWGEFVRRDPAGHRAHMQTIIQWALAGRISAHIDAVYPLERAAEALAAIARRQVKGKVVLKP